MKTEKKIEKCEKLLAELKAELLNKEPEFKVGDWVVIHTDNQCSYNIIGDIGRIIMPGHNFDWIVKQDGTSGDTGGIQHDSQFLRHATPEEIKAHLDKKRIELGYIEGVKVRCLSDNEVYTLSNKPHCHPYNKNDDRYWMSDYSEIGVKIYEKGKWAEIIEDEPISLTSEGYEARICTYGAVNIVEKGNDEFVMQISFKKLKEIYKAAKNKREKY